jgi:cytosine deaminase
MTDLVLRNVRPMGGQAVDMLVRGGRIAEIGPALDTPGTPEHDAFGQIAIPGLVEGHTHLDKTLMGHGWYVNAVGTDLRAMIENERKLRADPAIDPHVQSMRHALALIGNGITHIRSHVDIDTNAGLRMIEGVIATRDALAVDVTIQIVAFPQSGLLIRPGTLDLMDQALAIGADVVGGLDPCGIDRDPKGHLDAIFALAQKHGKPVDIHLHENGDLGAFTTDLILERTRALGMQGKVAISHAFCLGMNDYLRTGKLIDDIAALNICIPTTGAPSRDVPPVKRLRAAGVRMAAGSDGVGDSWSPHQRPDMLDRARIVAMKNNMRADDDLEDILMICTSEGAEVMGFANHRLMPGAWADIALVPAETLAAVAMYSGAVGMTLHRGRITARNGKALRTAP